MSNQLNNQPIQISTDISSWKSGQTLYASAKAAVGIRPYKVVITAATTTTAGNVTITDPNSSANLYPPVQIPSGSIANTVLYTDNLSEEIMTWRDFAVTGVTATGTQIWIYYRT